MSFLKNRTVIGIICILLALVICFGVTPLFNQSISQKIEIVRVTREIKAGDEITKDMVQTTEVGSYNLPLNVIYNKDEVIGRYAAAGLSIGDYILTTKISDVPTAENAYLYAWMERNEPYRHNQELRQRSFRQASERGYRIDYRGGL
jgi:pilus assembly protein CpaB